MMNDDEIKDYLNKISNQIDDSTLEINQKI